MSSLNLRNVTVALLLAASCGLAPVWADDAASAAPAPAATTVQAAPAATAPASAPAVAATPAPAAAPASPINSGDTAWMLTSMALVLMM